MLPVIATACPPQTPVHTLAPPRLVVETPPYLRAKARALIWNALMTLAEIFPQTPHAAFAATDTQRAHAGSTHSPAIRVPLWVYGLVALVVVLWAASVLMFGVPGLYIPAVALVPVVFGVLLLISRG